MPRQIKKPSNMTQSARDVLFHADPNEFRIRDTVVNGAVVLHHVVNGTIKDIQEQIISLLDIHQESSSEKEVVFSDQFNLIFGEYWEEL